jgi:hypothetical protein
MTRKQLLLLAVGGAIAVAVATRTPLFRRTPTWPARPGSAKRVSVLPFRATVPAAGWSAPAFAESLAVRLNEDPAIDARVGPAPAGESDFTLEGDVDAKDGHAVIAIRLTGAGQRASSWSATFWRAKLTDAALAADLARRVREGLGLAPERSDSAEQGRAQTTKRPETTR